MAEHTPGHWRTEPGDSIVRVAQSGTPNRIICAVSNKTYYQRFDEEDEANARLIAAAPELLEALKYLKPWLEEQVMDESAGLQEGDTPSIRFDKFNEALAAIAKATGND